MSSPYEVHAALEGYFDKRKQDAAIVRMGSYRIYESLVGKDAVDIERFWSLYGDEKKTVKPISVDKAMIDKILKVHKKIKK